MEANFNFTRLNKEYKFKTQKDLLEILTKWSMSDELSASCWAFDEPYQPHHVKELITALLRTPEAKEMIPWPQNNDISRIQPVPCSLTSLLVFDKILEPCNGVVLNGGSREIRGCYEEVVDGFLVNNLLQQMILNQESPVYSVISEEQRREFLFQLFGHLVVGGPYCQYEDFVQPYIDVTKVIYKDILSVQRSKDSGEVEIRSKVFRVLPMELENHQNFVYATVDPGLREVNLFTHRFS